MKQVGVILDEATLAPADLDLGALETSLAQWRRYPVTAAEDTARRLQGATVALTNKVVMDAAVMDANPQLRLIAIMATGSDHVDLEAARQRGIAVCNAVGYSTPAVVQHTFALMLALATRVHQYSAAVAAGNWSRSPHFCLLDYPVEELAGRTLGVVGYGDIGRAVARVATALGMEVAVAASLRDNLRDKAPAAAQRWPLPELLERVDVLSLHCPLTPRTRHLVDAESLERMRPGAWLINTARGALVEEQALLAALRSGRLGGAGLDVLQREPPPPEHPLCRGDIPNLVVTPHSAWVSRQSRQRLVDQLARVVAGLHSGQWHNRLV